MDRPPVATFCPHRVRRYTLWRDLQQLTPGPTLAFIMLNPSTADEDQDDPTIRRCKAFATREGASRLLITNLFGYRSTDPKGLNRPDNEDWTEGERSAWNQALRVDGPTVVAWGAFGPKWLQGLGTPRVAAVLAAAEEEGKPLYSLGVTKDGSPRHPLYVKASATLDRWPRK